MRSAILIIVDKLNYFSAKESNQQQYYGQAAKPRDYSAILLRFLIALFMGEFACN
jgi:hypothetical protein